MISRKRRKESKAGFNFSLFSHFLLLRSFSPRLPLSVSELQMSSSPSVKRAKHVAMKEEHIWSLLPEELLQIISEKVDNCFDVIHARSVCRPWRATFPFPAYLLRPSYTLPSFENFPRTFDKFPHKPKGSCTLEKVPLFLFRVRTPLSSASTSEFFLGGVNKDKSEDRMETPSTALQCSVKMKTKVADYTTLMNILDCQILPQGYQYRMRGWDPQSNAYRGVAFLPLNKEDGGGGGEFVVFVAGSSTDLLVLRSAEMRWMWFEKISTAACSNYVTFRGKFYLVCCGGHISVIDPYSLQETPLPHPQARHPDYLIPCGNDELFLVEIINPYPDAEVLDFTLFVCRVSRLDEEAGQWIVVTDLGDRILFIGDLGNCCCSAKDLPDGCGLSGNSILLAWGNEGVPFHAYKYGSPTEYEGDDLTFLRLSRENRMILFNRYPFVALRVDL